MNHLLTKFCRTGLLLLVAGACVVSIHPAAAAEPFEPVVECWIAGWDEWVSDADFLGSLVKNPSLGKALGRTLTAHSGVARLDGLDSSRPVGVMLGTDGLRLAPILYVPVTDAQALLTSLEPLIGPAQKQPQREHLWKIGRQAVTGYVLADHEWAYVAQTPDVFDHRPSNEAIARSMAALAAGTDVAITFYPQRLPEALRTMAIDMLREQAAAAGSPRKGESDEHVAARQRLTTASYTIVEQWFTDYEQARWSWSLDRQTRQGRLAVEAIAVADSSLAKALSGCRPLNRPGVAVTKDVALALDLACQLEPELAQRARSLMSDMVLVSARQPNGSQAGSNGDASADNTSRRRLVESMLSSQSGDRTIDGLLKVEGNALPLSLVALWQDGGQAVEQISKHAETGTRNSGLQVQRNEGDRPGPTVYALSCDCFDDQRLTRLFGSDRKGYVAKVEGASVLALGNGALAKLGNVRRPRADSTMPRSAAAELSVRLGGLSLLAESLMADRIPAMIVSLVAANMRAADDRIVLAIEPGERRLRTTFTVHDGVLRGVATGLSLAAMQTLSQQQADRKPR
jgi:hypothetical protein